MKKSRDGTMSQDVFRFKGGPCDRLFLSRTNDPETWLPLPVIIVSRGDKVAQYSYAGENTYNFVCLVEPADEPHRPDH